MILVIETIGYSRIIICTLNMFYICLMSIYIICIFYNMYISTHISIYMYVCV